jgi:hypothetical protein
MMGIRMAGFLERFHARALTGVDLDKLFPPIFLPFLAGNFLCFFSFDMEVQASDIRYYGIFAVTTILYGAVILWLYTHARPEVPLGGGMLTRVLASLAVGALLALTGSAYVYAINAASGSTEPVVLEGPVIALDNNHAGFAGIGRHVTVHFNGRPVTFSETAERFDGLGIGDTYRTEVKLGGLGYYWRPGRNYWK